MNSIAFAAALTLTLGGCAMSLSGGQSYTGTSLATRASTVAGVSSHAFRGDAPTFGLKLRQTFEHGFHIRSAMVNAGYDLHACNGTLALEPGLDVGGGMPANRTFPGTGAYAGPAFNVRVLIYGVEDRPLTFNLATVAVEFLATVRGGLWMPPENSARKTLVGEWGFELGLRVALASDLVTPPPGKVREVKGESESAKEGTP